MGILCSVGRHRPDSGRVWNDGYWFSRCTGCERDLIGRCGEWRTIPRGYRVVWRKRSAEDPRWDVASRPPLTRISDYLICEG